MSLGSSLLGFQPAKNRQPKPPYITDPLTTQSSRINAPPLRHLEINNVQMLCDIMTWNQNGYICQVSSSKSSSPSTKFRKSGVIVRSPDYFHRNIHMNPSRILKKPLHARRKAFLTLSRPGYCAPNSQYTGNRPHKGKPGDLLRRYRPSAAADSRRSSPLSASFARH